MNVLKTIYRSKIGAELVIPIVTILTGTLVLLGYQEIWVLFGLILLLGVFVLHILFTNQYIIEGKTLTVKSGFLFKKTIDVETISEIYEKRSVVNAPAASFDRLEIRLNEWDRVIISPKNKTEFVDKLKSLNPRILVR